MAQKIATQCLSRKAGVYKHCFDYGNQVAAKNMLKICTEICYLFSMPLATFLPTKYHFDITPNHVSLLTWCHLWIQSNVIWKSDHRLIRFRHHQKTCMHSESAWKRFCLEALLDFSSLFWHAKIKHSEIWFELRKDLFDNLWNQKLLN